MVRHRKVLRTARMRTLAITGILAALASGGSFVLAQAPLESFQVEPLLLDDTYDLQRHRLVDEILDDVIEDQIVLAAMRDVPRHLFVPQDLRHRAYENRPLPIGWDQTISQPYIVALMTELLELDETSRVLEIGTGSGYQAAVLQRVAGEVSSIEIVPEVAAFGARNLELAGVDDVQLRVGDGYLGWPEEAPFDGIIVTCAPDHVPEPLQEQLAEGGRLVIPVGPSGNQELVVVKKVQGELRRQVVIPVRFVPMTGPGAGLTREAPAKSSRREGVN